MFQRIFTYSVKMSGQVSLEAFVKRSALAEEKLVLLREHLANLRSATLARQFGNEEQQLREENERLKKQVQMLKGELVSLEKANGLKQVLLPQNVVPCSEQTPPAQKPAAQPDAKPKKAKQPKPKQEAKPKKSPNNAEGEKPVDVSRLDMRVAKIVSVKRHPDADTLYLEEIDVGESTLRQVVTGVVKFVPIEEMQDRMVVLMCNLKPAKMRGILSQAMVMCTTAQEHLEILDPPPGSVPGDRITFDGYTGPPDAQLNPKKKVWEKIQPDLNTNDQCVACYKGIPFTVQGKGVVKSKTLKNTPIK